jgi:hypothetical protein
VAENHRLDPLPSPQRRRVIGASAEKGLVDVPALQMTSCIQKVQLVSMEAISPGEGHLQYEQGSSDQEHRPGGKLARDLNLLSAVLGVP